MLQSTARLYTSEPTSYQAQAFADYLARSGGYQHVEVLDVAQLPAPNKAHCVEQMLRNELLALNPQLTSCLDFIRLAENNPARYGHELPALRQERDSLEFRLAEINRVLVSQKGGPDNG